MSVAVSFFVALSAIFFLLCTGYFRTGRMLRCIVFTAFSGEVALGLLTFAGTVLPIPFALTPFTIAVSGILGVPGVLLLLLFPLV